MVDLLDFLGLEEPLLDDLLLVRSPDMLLFLDLATTIKRRLRQVLWQGGVAKILNFATGVVFRNISKVRMTPKMRKRSEFVIIAGLSDWASIF